MLRHTSIIVFTAVILSVAAVSTAAFQSRSPSHRTSTSTCVVGPQPSIPIGRGTPNALDRGGGRLRASESDGRVASAEKAPGPAAPSASVLSPLEAGRVDDAVAELRKFGVREVPPSTHHAVIEVCCAGGGFDRNRRRKSRGPDRIEIAAELLLRMGDDATAHANEIILSGYARRGRWRDASKTLAAMEEANFGPPGDAGDGRSNPSPGAYLTVLAALARANEFQRVNSLLAGMRRGGVRPNAYAYNTLLKICASEGVPRWKEALSLLSQCQREPGVTPDLITYTTAMRACARGRQEGKAMELFRAAGDLGLEPDAYFYTTAMDACAKGSRRNSWRTALELLDEMKGKGIAPNEVTYGVAVTACGNGGQWKRALELLDQMRATHLRINTITYNSAITALSRAARVESRQNSTGGDSDADLLWEKALDLIRCMEKDGVRKDSFTYSSAISTCGAAGKWQEAVNLIKAMKGDGIRPNKVAYTSAITACANSRQWDPAFELFNDLKKDRIQLDIVAYNALIGAGMTAKKPAEVFDLWLEMCQSSNEKLLPDIVTLTEVIATLDGAPGRISRDRVDRVFSEAVARGLILRADSLDTSWEFDLHAMSLPVARAACRFIFRRIAERSAEGEEGAVSDLSLITGTSRTKELVREVLRDELRPAVYCVVTKSQQGTLLVKEQMMRNYIEGYGVANDKT